MSAVKKNKEFGLSKFALSEWKKKTVSDAIERDRILVELEGALSQYSDEQTISWFNHEVKLQEGSSLYEVYNPGRQLLVRFLEKSPVYSAITQEGGRLDLVTVRPGVKLETLCGSEWFDLIGAGYFRSDKSLIAEVQLISEIADVAGGYIWPDLNVTLDQWLGFHEITLPENKTNLSQLIKWLKFDPQVDEPGDYWEYFEVDDQACATLSAKDFADIRKATLKLNNGESLLETFHKFSTAAISHENAAQRITDFVSAAQTRQLAECYLKELGWHGASAEEEVCEETLRQLLVTAIILDLHPSIESLRRRQNIFGFDLESPSHVEWHSAAVREKFTEFLRGKLNVRGDLAPLANHLLLARMAPELLVRDVPASATMGSIAWTHFCHAVVLVEAAKTGASRVMNYSQIMAYADLEPISDAQKHLRDLAMIDPIVNWALINQVVTPNEIEHAEEATTRRALEAFEQHSEKFVQVARVYSTALPSRADIARAALNVAAPGCDTLDEKALSEQGGQQVMSMVDLHQSGDLVTGKWDRRTVRLIVNGLPKPPINYNPSGISLYTRYPKLRTLTSCDEEMDRQLAVYLTGLNSAMLSTVKLALAHMPEQDLRAFLGAQIHFFTVRGSAVYTVNRPAGGPLSRDRERETQQSRDAATGRFGLVMAVYDNNTFICYELFTSRGEFRKNDALGALIIRQRTMEQRTRMSRPADLTLQQTLTYPQSVPLDLNRYTHATVENPSVTRSMAIIDYFGALPSSATAANPQRGFYQRFNDPCIARIAEFIVNQRPFLNARELRELVRVPTPLESAQEESQRLITYFIDLVVPFKRCIEDIASGEQDKMIDGAYGCLMDGIGLAGTVAGAGSRALSISLKAISATSKAARLTKLAFTSGISLFNPIDGVPTGMMAGSKLVHKGALRFSKQTHDLLAKATRQTRALSAGRKPLFFLESAGGTPSGLGNWRPRGAASEAVNVVAARHDNKWYALNRRGNVWGKPLDGFTYAGPLPLSQSSKKLPASYTRRFIMESLPIAQVKIDNALETLGRHDFKRDCAQLMTALFGDTSAVATERLANYLRLIRFDFAGFSLSNIALDSIKENSTLAAFDLDSYKRWKSAGPGGDPDVAFVEVYTANLNKHFVSMGFNHAVVADDLIHELFHASAQTDDIGYATDAQPGRDSTQQVDVVALLNIAAGRLPVSEGSTLCHAPASAFANADSLALATSLLSQRCTDKTTYDRNMIIITNAIETSGDKAVIGPVVITLNKQR